MSRSLPLSAADVSERHFWDDYMRAFEEAIQTTSGERAPWYVVPCGQQWFIRLVVAIVGAIEKLDLSYPRIDAAKKKELMEARAALARES